MGNVPRWRSGHSEQRVSWVPSPKWFAGRQGRERANLRIDNLQLLDVFRSCLGLGENLHHIRLLNVLGSIVSCDQIVKITMRSQVPLPLDHIVIGELENYYTDKFWAIRLPPAEPVYK